MLTIVRDRIQDAIKKGMTLEQVKTARLARDYEGRYGATQGAWTTDAFIEVGDYASNQRFHIQASSTSNRSRAAVIRHWHVEYSTCSRLAAAR